MSTIKISSSITISDLIGGVAKHGSFERFDSTTKLKRHPRQRTSGSEDFDLGSTTLAVKGKLSLTRRL